MNSNNYNHRSFVRDSGSKGNNGGKKGSVEVGT